MDFKYRRKRRRRRERQPLQMIAQDIKNLEMRSNIKLTKHIPHKRVLCKMQSFIHFKVSVQNQICILATCKKIHAETFKFNGTVI